MRCVTLTALALCISGCALAQFEGHILLTDGSQESGTISYNEKTAIVSFKDGDKTGTYNARNLVGFNFFDPTSKQQRKFFSMEYEMRDGGQKTNQFFEIVREYKNFAVLIKTDPVSFRKKLGVTNAVTVYFINDNLGVRPYIEFQTNKAFTQLRVLDRDLPKDLLGDDYKKVYTYAEKNDLYWDVKEDLVAIMDYYNSLK